MMGAGAAQLGGAGAAAAAQLGTPNANVQAHRMPELLDGVKRGPRAACSLVLCCWWRG